MNIVFDLDGTLIDSAPDLHAAANRMLAEEGAAALSLDEVIGFIGNGIPTLVERVMRARGLDQERHSDLLARYRAFYDADAATLTRPYPGVVAALSTLARAGHQMGICTNKPEAPARSIIAGLDLAAFFPVIVGGDSCATKKPDPAPLVQTFARLGPESPGGAVYVGDSEVDAETARAAGVPFLLFTEGYRKSRVEALPHHAAFSDFAALPAMVAALCEA